MKKLVIALTTFAAFTAPALAADMAVKTPMRAAAPLAYAPSWTGCYIGGGGGYGLWNQENTWFVNGPPRTQSSQTTTEGGRGYFGTVGGGCDYQFGFAGLNLVVGAFGDYDFSSLKANVSPGGVGFFGEEKMSSAWSAGGRVGWVVLPNLLTYFTAGWTEATFDRTNLSSVTLPATAATVFLDKRTFKGWFLGAGDEYALSFMPGLFWKTEYRFSEYDRETNPLRFIDTGLLEGSSLDSKKFVHTVRSELVYRFNWGKGPISARY